MALLAKILGIRPFRSSEHRSQTNLTEYEHQEGRLCPNETCITHSGAESRYLVNRLLIAKRTPVMLRCDYCETNVPIHFIGNKINRTFTRCATLTESVDLKTVAFFPSEEQ